MTDVVLIETDPSVQNVESPFLADTNIQYAWDATSLEYLKRCPRLYYYKMIRGLHSPAEDAPLRYGSEVHQSLHEYELLKADGIDHDEAVFHVVRELLHRTNGWRPDHKYKNRRYLLEAVIGYLDKYKNDPAKTLIMPDGKPAAELSFRFELDWCPNGSSQPYVLCGHLDRVVTFNDATFVMDHKTTTTTPSDYYWKQFEPHNQMTLYTLASGVIFETVIKGVIINAIQTTLENGPKIVRGTTYRTKSQLDEWIGDLSYWLTLSQEFAKNNYWPMNDTACDKYGGCRFRDICSKSSEVREKFIKADFVEAEPWNPLNIR